MTSSKQRSLLLASICTALLTSSGCALASQSGSDTSVVAPQLQGFEVNLERGQVLQVIAPQSREDGLEARQRYYEKTLPPAQELGFQRHGQLNVRQKVVSDFDPGAFILFSWPSQAAFDEFEAKPGWPAIAATRPDGWEELKIYSLELQEDLKLRFDPDKHYSVVVAWFDDEGRAGYSQYLDGIEPAVNRAGGRFIFKMESPRLETHNSPDTPPGQMTFVEWDTPDGFADAQKTPEYRAHQRYFAGSVKLFEFYWLQTQN